jgi:glyoxylase-like metal-dependent hydrolase (beta-lactamase superfamily II)
MVDPPTGTPVQLEPLVARVLAPNPSPYTGTGTQTHLVGTADLAVIDPGPDDPAHLDALLRGIAERPVRAILVTHHHRDHSPATRPLARATGAPIVGAAPTHRGADDGRADAAFDADYLPDRVLEDSESVGGEGWMLTALATPGHTSNHLCFALSAEDGPETAALFSGDHVMGWSTSVVSPPDGDMGEYMRSLERVLARDDRVYYPAHGEAVDKPQRLVRGMLGHRRQREGQILRLVAEDSLAIRDMVARMYVGLDTRLRPAAEASVLAHLVDLDRRGLVRTDGGVWRAMRP